MKGQDVPFLHGDKVILEKYKICPKSDSPFFVFDDNEKKNGTPNNNRDELPKEEYL